MLKDLKLNDNLIVRDNSYCYEIKTNSDGSKYLEKAYLHPEYHQNTKYPFDLKVIDIRYDGIFDGVWTFDGQVVEVVDKDRKHFIVGVCWDVPFTYDSYISEDYEIWPSDDFNSYDDYDEECFLNNE